jgi:hypothetical protein
LVALTFLGGILFAMVGLLVGSELLTRSGLLFAFVVLPLSIVHAAYFGKRIKSD